jgi:hypothetical protein
MKKNRSRKFRGTVPLKLGVGLTYGVSFEELHGALEEVGEHPLVHDGPRPRS